MTTIKAKTRRTCDQLGVCQGRETPCLNCKLPDAPQWPAERDTYRITELLTSPFVIAAAIGVVGGFLYGVVRYALPCCLF